MTVVKHHRPPLLSTQQPAAPLNGLRTADRKAARRSATPSSEGTAGGLQCDLQEYIKKISVCVCVCVGCASDKEVV